MINVIKHYTTSPRQHNLGGQIIHTPIEIDLKDLEEKAYLAGYQQATDQNLILNEVQCKQLKDLLIRIPQEVTHYCQQQSPQLIDLLCEILPTFFIHNAFHKENIEHAIHKTIQEIEQEQIIEVYLSEEDFILFKNNKITLTLPNSISIKASQEVLLGGCLIKTHQGLFDSRLETQIDKLKHWLLNYKIKVAHA